MSAPGASATAKTFTAITVLALVARLLVFWVNGSQAEPLRTLPDSRSYVQSAEDLRGIAGALDGMDWARGMRTPAYPALLASVFSLRLGSPDDLAGVLALQLLLGSLAAGVAFLVAAKLAGPTAGAVAGVLVAIEPSGLAFSNLVMTECLYSLYLVLLVWSFAHALRRPTPGNVVLVGLVLSVAPLIKPAALPLVFVVSLVLLAWPPATRLRRAAAALVLVLALVPAGLWSLRNLNQFGTFQLSMTGGWAQAIFAYHVAVSAQGKGSAEAGEHYWLMEYGEERGLSRGEVETERSRYFGETLRAHPVAAARVWTLTLVRMLGVPDAVLAEQLLEAPPSYTGGSVVSRLRWVAALGLLAPLIVLGMAIAPLAVLALPFLLLRGRAWPREQQATLALIVLVALYHLAIGALVQGLGSRYRAPALPLLAIVAVVAANEAWRLWAERPGAR